MPGLTKAAICRYPGRTILLEERARRRCRFADEDRQPDLRDVAAVASGEFVDDDVAVAQFTFRCPRRAEDQMRVVRRRGRENQEVDVASAAVDGARDRRPQILLGGSRSRSVDHGSERVGAELARHADALQFLVGLDAQQGVEDVVDEHDLGVRQCGGDRLVLVDRHVIAEARVDRWVADSRALEPFSRATSARTWPKAPMRDGRTSATHVRWRVFSMRLPPIE